MVFGGIHELTQELCDLHAFDFNKMQWFAMIDENNYSPSNTASPHINFGYSPGRKSFGKSMTAMNIPIDGSSRNANRTVMKTNEPFTISMTKLGDQSRSRQGNR